MSIAKVAQSGKMVKSRAEGEAKGRADVARNLKQKGQPTALIAEVKGLSEKEIDDL